ncbi:hypothetical protein [Almyronema epifaneia]|uniref:Uncharacterized protein n=1 Tax=Almyronema epifaneia S1 TaxID=2991925 RepID=A0ABW6IJK3_9CYAN
MDYNQLKLSFSFLIAAGITTREVYKRLECDLPKHKREKIIKELGRHARLGQSYELHAKAGTGVWYAFPVQQTATGRYLWDLYFQQVNSLVA